MATALTIRARGINLILYKEREEKAIGEHPDFYIYFVYHRVCYRGLEMRSRINTAGAILTMQKDVRCTDCHDVHSQQLKIEGNGLWLNCHREDTYNTPDHHSHKKF